MSHPKNACIGQGVTFFFPLALYNMRRQWAALAQLVEHIIRNDGVSSSSLLSGTTYKSITYDLVARAASAVQIRSSNHLAITRQDFAVNFLAQERED